MSPVKRIRLSALALALGFCACAATPAGAEPAVPPRYVMTAWAAEKGLPPGDVFAIAQDTDGYLWLGTPSGLLRFDGSRFTAWPPPEMDAPLPTAPVHALVGAPDGSLWVGFGGGGGVVRIRRREIVRYSTSDGAPPGVTDMIQDRQGTIWVATRRGLYRCIDGKWAVVGAEEGFEASDASSIYEDRDGQLWVGTGRGIYRKNGDRFALSDATVLGVQSLAADESGAIWATDPNRILRKLSSKSAVAHSSDIRMPASAWRLMLDRQGQLWAAAFGSGLLRVTNPTGPSPIIERVEYEHRLAGSPRSLFQDRDGHIWVGMRGGLLRLSERSFASPASLEGLTNEGVRTATVGRDGSVWVATGHGLNRFTGVQRTSYSLAQTMALHTDRQGSLWVSAAQRVGKWIDGRLLPVDLPGDVGRSRVMAMTSDARGTLWLCTSLRGVMTWNGRELQALQGGTPLRRSGGQGDATLASRSCQSIYTDSQDRVWLGFLSGGAAVHDHGSVHTFTVADGMTPGTVLAILEDRNGAVWLSTSTGISRYRSGRLTPITRVNAPLADLVPVLVEDHEGYIWAGVNSGASVIRFHPDEVDRVAANPAHQLEYALYDETDGMQQGSQTWQSGVGGVRGGDGRLWLATGMGMTIIDPARLPPRRPPAVPRIEEVTADGRRLSPASDLRLPAGTSTLRIGYGSVSLASAAKLRFRYMLEGVDPDWVHAGTAREATYANVASGDYRFRVSTTHDGRWTEAAFWDFSVAPPFYRTGSFVALIALAAGSMVVLGWWLRLRAVRSQYALVFAERARVSREIHDTLLQSLAAIGVELESIATELDPSQEPARAGLRRLRRQVTHCLREARESILELRDNTLMKPRPLVDSLRRLAETTTTSKGVTAEFSCSGRPRPCSHDGEIQLLRIAQEAINNAIRHGRATLIRLGLAYRDDEVVLTVVDDGCGFVPDEPDLARAGEHLGLVTMRERAARVRGRLTIVSSPGQGATIEATVPVTPV
jgi:signal transduction histidine kinase/ligand-binding sensor domain-containing protein